MTYASFLNFTISTHACSDPYIHHTILQAWPNDLDVRDNYININLDQLPHPFAIAKEHMYLENHK